MNRLRYFIGPFDVLSFRGNRLFGSAGSFGESLMPPWPSVVAGAIRTALLVERGHNLVAFAQGQFSDDEELGTPDRPGSFTVTGFDVARRFADGRVEMLHASPADLTVHDSSNGGGPQPVARRITPKAVLRGIQSSAATSLLAVLATPSREKAMHTSWLNSDGWREHLLGNKIRGRRQIVSTDELWRTERRIGIALDPARLTAENGALFTSQMVATRKSEHLPIAFERNIDSSRSNVGFLAELTGVHLPESLTLRLGGDGRVASASLVHKSYLPDSINGRIYRDILTTGRCRVILTTPGLFARGWQPTGVVGDGRHARFNLHGVTAHLVCAVVPWGEVVSGFDLARRCPKPAQRIAPTGTVYWLDEVEATQKALRSLVDRGLWSDPVENYTRRAEGFNRFQFAKW